MTSAWGENLGEVLNLIINGLPSISKKDILKVALNSATF